MAIQLNGSSQYASRTTSLPPFTGYSACGWARIDADTNAGHGLCGLNNATDRGIVLLFSSDGTTLDIWNGLADTTFASSPGMASDFFWAITAAAAGVNGYWRGYGTNTFVSASTTDGTSGTPSRFAVGVYPTGIDSEFLNGRIWNVKCWDRVLTAAELLVESFYQRVMYPASLNFHWPLRNSADTRDLGPNARPPTFTASPTTTNEVGLFAPRRRVYVPPAAAAAGGWGPLLGLRNNRLVNV
jgi:hypothetical protein